MCCSQNRRERQCFRLVLAEELVGLTFSFPLPPATSYNSDHGSVVKFGLGLVLGLAVAKFDGIVTVYDCVRVLIYHTYDRPTHRMVADPGESPHYIAAVSFSRKKKTPVSVHRVQLVERKVQCVIKFTVLGRSTGSNTWQLSFQNLPTIFHRLSSI